MENPRRRRFVAWYTLNYPGPDGRTRFMRDTARSGQEPLTKGRVSQLFDDNEPFGQRAGEALAERLQLAKDFFEHDSAASTIVIYKPLSIGAVAQMMAQRVNRLTDTRRDKIANSIGALVRSGPNDDEAADLDALAGDIAISVPVAPEDDLWRTVANQIADGELDGKAREIVTTFLQAVDLKVADARKAREQGAIEAPAPQDN